MLTVTMGRPAGRPQRRHTLSGDLMRGDPAVRMLGRTEEQPARHHSPQRAKPWSEARLRTEVRERMAELRPLVREHDRLQKAIRALEKVR
jgi:hypothetical protein